MREHERIPVHTDAYGMRLLDFLERRWPDVHRAYFRRLVLAEMVKVNRIVGTPYTRLRRGDIVDITRPEGEPPPRPVRHDLTAAAPRLVHTDEMTILFDKPAGTTLEAALGALGDAVPDQARPVLRVEAEASGLVLLARDPAAARTLAAEFAEQQLEVEWTALVQGRIASDALTIDKPLGPDRRHPGRVRVYARDAKRSRQACTEVVTVEVFARHSLLRVLPRTDRGHQIRVHLAAAHHPIVGDEVYGGGGALFVSAFKRNYRPRIGLSERPILTRLCLHSSAVRRRDQHFAAPLPKDFAAALTRLRRYADR